MDLNTPEGRLQTFVNWPTDHPLRPESLAEAGQYYTGEDEKTDETRCYVCGGRLHNWEAGDDPFEEHKTTFPDCPLSQNPATPVIHSAQASTADRAERADRAGAVQEEITEGISSLSIHHQKAPVPAPNRDAKLRDRYYTFNKRWPKHLRGFLLQQNLALAGFEYTGEGDMVRCFSCGLEMCNWNKEDIPYDEHMREQPQCDFIRNIKFQLDNGWKVPVTQLPCFDVPPDYCKMPAVAQEKLSEKKELSSDVADSPCVMCQEKPREVLFEPCSHFVVCEICSIECSHCPVCHSIIIKKSKYAKSRASSTQSVST